LTPKEAIEYTCEELAERIAAVFVGLYPLVLLTLEEDPTRSIHAYLGWDEEEERPIQPPYSLEACAEATGFPMGDLRSWVAAIHRKRQAILYGPPGTGKTFLAKELARHLVGNGDGFVDLVQFHPAYSYEDFIQGIRPQQAPDGNGLDYPVLSGRFLRFCREAAQRRGICALIIDEINRANLARVFGELMYLLEYRDDRVKLAVSGDEFAIPANVRLLGTMNTADRSIALVDHALRRRFAFVGLFPRYEVLTSWHAKEGTGFDPTGLIAVLKRLNHAIDDPNYAVGISFFLVSQPQRDLPSIWQMEIEPYLEEYFFDQRDTVEQFRWDKIAGEVLGS
jgi:5-methylcytosine-specific restriction protein B